MRVVPRALWPAALIGLAFFQARCQSRLRPWVPPQEVRAKIISEATFLRTGLGDYVEGYLAECESHFQTETVVMVLELPCYRLGDRLIVTGRLTDDSVRLPLGDRTEGRIPVFDVTAAKPNVPKAPVIPALK